MKRNLEGAGFSRIVGFALGVLLLGSISAELQGMPGDSAKTRLVSSRAKDAYVLGRRNHLTTMNMSIDEVVRLQRRLSGDFLWFRRAGRAYLVRDGAILAEAFDLFKPMDELTPEMANLERRQRELDRKQSVLDREQEELDRLADGFDDEDDEEGRHESERRDLERRQRDLKPRLRLVEEEERKLEAVERSLDERQEVLEKRAEEQLFELIDRTIRRGMAEAVGR